MDKIIETYLLRYGFLPVLICVERLCEREDYLLCHDILKTIKGFNEKYDLDIPTEITTESIANMKLEFMVNHNLMGDIAYANREHYADTIMNEIFKNYDERC